MDNKNEIKESFRYIEQNISLLTESQATFIKSLNKYFKKNKILSDRQLNVLYDIRNNLK
jgi:hypothetical protein